MNIKQLILSIILLNLTSKSFGQVVEPVKEKPLKIISDSTNKLTGNIEIIELEYIIGDKPNWRVIEDYGEISEEEENEARKNSFIYIEPANKSLIVPQISFDEYRHRLKLKGQYYIRKDYPQGTTEIAILNPKSRVFRYTDMEVIDNPDFRTENKIDTLIMVFNNRKCTCAQWSVNKIEQKNDKIEYYWLEPADNKLLNVDTLGNDMNKSISVRVIGQIVSKEGLPKNKLKTVSPIYQSNLFRYTQIEVIQN